MTTRPISPPSPRRATATTAGPRSASPLSSSPSPGLGLVSAAARAVGMSARNAYRLRARDTLGSFAAAWDAAVDEGRRSALDTGIVRAIEGETVPIYYRGRKVGEYRRFNDRLLLAALLATVPRAPASAMGNAIARPGRGR